MAVFASLDDYGQLFSTELQKEADPRARGLRQPTSQLTNVIVGHAKRHESQGAKSVKTSSTLEIVSSMASAICTKSNCSCIKN
jgi:hypothetical protein